MVNKGQIHMELGKIMMISSNLIKSDDKSVIEIEKIMKEDLKTNPRHQKSMNLTLISRRNWRLNRDNFSENLKNEKPKIKIKFT